MTQLITTYDDTQHCTAADTSKGKSVAMDCPYTGKGEELSPGNLLEAALSGCMLMSMGAVATRDGIGLTDTVVEVELVGTPPPKIGYSAINVVVKMPNRTAIWYIAMPVEEPSTASQAVVATSADHVSICANGII